VKLAALSLAAGLAIGGCASKPPASPKTPPDADWYQRVMDLIVSGQKEEALKILDRVVKKEPNNPWALANRGTVLLNLHRYDEAGASYLEALKYETNSPYLLCCVATVFFQKGKLLDSLDWADKALAADPKFAAAMATKAKTLKALGRGDEAEPLFEKAFQLDASLKSQFEP
jgi:tetratricopeptide (TPR) repeat protein